MTKGFRYRRRVHFAETDLVGIVHFSWMFRYMEEAEHTLWRQAGMCIAEPESDLGWPRVAASFEYRSPLHFEDEFEVTVRLVRAGTRSLQYEHTIRRGDTLIGTGSITTVCVRKAPGGEMRSTALPDGVVDRLEQLDGGAAD